MKRTWWVLGATLLALACSDGFFFEPPTGTADLAVAFGSSPTNLSAATLVSAFDKADEARIAMRRSSGTPVLDTIVPFDPGNPAVELALSFTVPEEGETFALVGALLSQSEVVFQGETTVTLAPDRSTTAEIEIEPMVTGIVAPPSLTFDALLDTAVVPVYGLFSTGDSIPGIEVQWAVLDPDVVELAPGGALVSVGEGSTQAIAQSGTFADTTDVAVAAVVDAVTVSPDLVNADVDQEIQFSATARDRNGNALSREASWSVDDESVAVIDSDGLLLTVEEGTATITAEIEGEQGTAQLTVTREVPLVASVTVEPDPAEVWLGGTTQLQAIARDNQGAQLTGRPVEWSSSNAGVARVSAAGLVTGVTLGSATITATVEGVPGDGSVEVVPVPVGSVEVTPDAATVLVGDELALTATVTDANGDPAPGRAVTWESSATAVATVDSDGVVTAVGQGTATITATSEGEQGSAVITVPIPTPMAGGTYHLSAEGSSFFGTAVLYDPNNALAPGQPIDQVTLNGPSGWHGDEELVCIPFYLDTEGLAGDRAVCLEFPDAVTGTYSGRTPLGETRFPIDASSSIPIPVIDAVLTSGTSIASVEWSGDPSHASYAVELWDLDAFDPLAIVIVPGSDRDATFDVSLDPDTEYGFLLVAFDIDLTAEGAPFPSAFNAAETDFEAFFTASPSEFWVTGYDDASVTIFEQPSNNVIGGDSGFLAVHLADIVFTPDGVSAWVADVGEEFGTVYGFDTGLGEASTSIEFGSYIERLALSPGGDTLYATSDDGILYHYDPLFDEAWATTDLGSPMGGLAVTPDGAKVYVSLIDGTVAVVSTSAPGSFSTIAVGSDPRGVAIHGDRVYVANYGSNTVSVIDTSTDAVVGSPIPVGAGPEDVEVSPCGCFAYVVNQIDGTVSVIDTFEGTVVGSPIPVGLEPQSVAFAPVDELAYVTNYGDETVSVISTISDEVLETLDLGSGGPWGVAVFPHGAEVPSASRATTPPATLRLKRRTR